MRAAVSLAALTYWELNNLEIINDSGDTKTGATDDYRAGVRLHSGSDNAIRHDIHLRDLVIHDVFPETGALGHAIHVLSEGSSTIDTYFDGIVIEDCEISLVGRYGAWFQHRGTGRNVGFDYNKSIEIRNCQFTNC